MVAPVARFMHTAFKSLCFFRINAFFFVLESQVNSVGFLLFPSNLVEESNRGLKLAYMALPRRYLSFRHTLRSDDTLHF